MKWSLALWRDMVSSFPLVPGNLGVSGEASAVAVRLRQRLIGWVSSSPTSIGFTLEETVHDFIDVNRPKIG